MLVILPRSTSPIASADHQTNRPQSPEASSGASTQPSRSINVLLSVQISAIPQNVFAEVLRRIQQGPAGIESTKLVEPTKPAITVDMLTSLNRV